ncbi:hypothetical protein ACE6H2_000756 [Prunus campanulata]
MRVLIHLIPFLSLFPALFSSHGVSMVFPITSRHPLPPSLVSKFAKSVQEQFFMHNISHSLSSILLLNPDTSFAEDPSFAVCFVHS